MRRALARADARSRRRGRASLLRSGRPLARALAVAPRARAVGGDRGRPAHPRLASMPSGGDVFAHRPGAAQARLVRVRRAIERVVAAMTPDEYCQQKAAQSGSSFYYSFLFLPPPRRRAITALYAFCREVDDVVDEVHDADVAQAKLAWWRQEIARSFDGIAAASGRAGAGAGRARVRAAATSTSRRSSTAWRWTSTQHALPRLRRARAATATASRASSASCRRRSSATPNPSTRGYARDLGIAFQLTNICRDVGEDARRGRIYLPQEDLARFGVTPSSLLRAEYSRRVPRADGVRGRARAASGTTARWRNCPPADRQAQRTGLVMAAIYRTLLDEIARDGYRVLDRRTSLTPVRKLWIAWKTARKSR